MKLCTHLHPRTLGMCIQTQIFNKIILFNQLEYCIRRVSNFLVESHLTQLTKMPTCSSKTQFRTWREAHIGPLRRLKGVTKRCNQNATMSWMTTHGSSLNKSPNGGHNIGHIKGFQHLL